MASTKSIPLLDDEGAITDQFCDVLKAVYLRYSSPPPASTSSTPAPSSPSTKSEGTLGREDFARFSADTNGQPLTDDTWEEVVNFLDLEEDRLTFKGFLQLYQLQTENEEEETIRDLTAWGYNLQTLELVTSRKDGAPDEGVKPPLEELTGIGQGGEKKTDSSSSTVV